MPEIPKNPNLGCSARENVITPAKATSIIYPMTNLANYPISEAARHRLIPVTYPKREWIFYLRGMPDIRIARVEGIITFVMRYGLRASAGPAAAKAASIQQFWNLSRTAMNW
jgi:hypothetical protein